MRVFYITFRSVTYAQRGERLLQQAGYRCMLQRTPRWMEERGCGYCLRLREARPDEAVMLLKRWQVPLRKVYIQGDNGELEELVL